MAVVSDIQSSARLAVAAPSSAQRPSGIPSDDRRGKRHSSAVLHASTSSGWAGSLFDLPVSNSCPISSGRDDKSSCSEKQSVDMDEDLSLLRGRPQSGTLGGSARASNLADSNLNNVHNSRFGRGDAHSYTTSSVHDSSPLDGVRDALEGMPCYKSNSYTCRAATCSCGGATFSGKGCSVQFVAHLYEQLDKGTITAIDFVKCMRDSENGELIRCDACDRWIGNNYFLSKTLS